MNASENIVCEMAAFCPGTYELTHRRIVPKDLCGYVAVITDLGYNLNVTLTVPGGGCIIATATELNRHSQRMTDIIPTMFSKAFASKYLYFYRIFTQICSRATFNKLQFCIHSSYGSTKICDAKSLYRNVGWKLFMSDRALAFRYHNLYFRATRFGQVANESKWFLSTLHISKHGHPA